MTPVILSPAGFSMLVICTLFAGIAIGVLIGYAAGRLDS